MFGKFIKRVRGWFKASAAVAVGGVRAAFGGAFGGWVTNHHEEAQRFRGWNYVAIRAIALQALQASCTAYQDAGVASRAKRRSLKLTGRWFKAYEVGSDAQDRPLADDHPLAKILDQPNPYQSGGMFRYEQVIQLQLTGSCFTWNRPNEYGLPIERYVIPTSALQVMPPCEKHPDGFYRVMPLSLYQSRTVGEFLNEEGPIGLRAAAGLEIPAQEMQVTRWPHPLFKDDGHSPISAAAAWNDTADQIDVARWAHLKNGPDVSLVIAVGEGTQWDETKADRAAAKFNKKYAGAQNTGKAAFVPPGSQVTKLSYAPIQMAYDASFLQFRDASLAIHGVAPVAAGILEGGSYAAFYASLKQTQVLTVQPVLSLLADEDTRRLAPWYGEGLSVDIEAPAFDEPDLMERQIATDIAAGAITVDEVRALRGRPPLGGERGNAIAGSTASSPMSPLAPGGPSPDQTGVPPAGAAANSELAVGEPGDLIDAAIDGPQRLVSVKPLKRLNLAVPVGANGEWRSYP